MVSTEFANEVKDRVEQRMGGGAEAAIVHTRKNNGIRLTGLTVRRPDSNVAPTVYIEDFEGHGADEAAEMAIRLIERSEEGVDQDALAREAAGFIGNRNGVLKRVLPRVINRKWNREMLEEMPHRGFLDLAITYQVPVGGMGSVRITNATINAAGITEDELYGAAMENAGEQGCDVYPLGNVLESAGYPTLPEEDGMRLLIATNRSNFNGAYAILMDGALRGVAEKEGSDVYIIPSSIHEIILVPECPETDGDSISEMVHTVNRTTVSEMDRLSDSVYIYRRKTGRVEIAVAG